jgi:hypothetical protein
MTVRLIVAVALACMALVGLLLAVIRPSVHALMISAFMVTVVVVVLVVNEYVRSGGRYSF